MARRHFQIRHFKPYSSSSTAWFIQNYTPKIMYETDRPDNYDLVPGILKDEVNKAGSFEFDIYPSHPQYYEIAPFQSYVSVEDKAESDASGFRYLFYGRVLNCRTEVNMSKHVVCEGLLANLLDIPAFLSSSDPHKVHSIKSNGSGYLFGAALDSYYNMSRRNDIVNDGVDANIQVTAEDMFEYTESLNQSCGDFITSLVDTFGGVLRLRITKQNDYAMAGSLRWMADPLFSPGSYRDNPQEFIYGDNIISASFDTADTSLLQGVGFYCIVDDDEEQDHEDKKYRMDIVGIPNSQNYMPNIRFNSNISDKASSSWNFPIVYPIKMIKVEAVTGNEYTAEKSYDFDVISDSLYYLYCRDYNDDVTVTAVDKYYLNQSNYRIRIMDRVHVKIDYADYDAYVYCLSYEIDLKDPAKCTFKFGDYKAISSQKAYYVSRYIKSTKDKK